VPLVRVLGATAGRSAVQRALPLYLGLLLVGSVLFEGSGVRPADVVAAAEHSRATRLEMYGVWTIVSLPALRGLLCTPSTFFLRTLPVARWRLLSIQGAGVLLAELPWAAFWIRGGGLGRGLAAAFAAVALGSLLLTRASRWADRTALALVFAVLLVGVPCPVLGVVGLPLAVYGVFSVWLRAPEFPERRAHGWVGGPPLVGLGSSYLLLLARQASAQLLRALAFLSLALLYAVFALRNLRPSSGAEIVSWALWMFTPALVLALSGLVGPLLRIEAQLGWLVRVCGTSERTQRGAPLGVLGLTALGFALLHTVGVVALAQLSLTFAARLFVYELASAGAFATLLLALARWAVRGEGHDGLRLIQSVGVLLAVSLALLALLPVSAPFVWVGFALFSAASGWPRSTEAARARAHAELEKAGA
jgi:hypothetical protein